MDLVVAEIGRLNSLTIVIAITSNSLSLLHKDRLRKRKLRLLQPQVEKTRMQHVSV